MIYRKVEALDSTMEEREYLELYELNDEQLSGLLVQNMDRLLELIAIERFQHERFGSYEPEILRLVNSLEEDFIKENRERLLDEKTIQKVN